MIACSEIKYKSAFRDLVHENVTAPIMSQVITRRTVLTWKYEMGKNQGRNYKLLGPMAN